MKKLLFISALCAACLGAEHSIIGVGDIMLGSNYPSDLLPNKNILANTEHILKDADITVGNLEGTLFDSGGTPKRCSNPNACYVFRTPSSYGQFLKQAGFDYLSMANNHSNDFGPTGRAATMANLDKLGIKYAGLLNKAEIARINKNGIRYAFISFAPNAGCVGLNNINYAKNLVARAKKGADVVIAMFHGGAEGAKYQHVTGETEYFYGENRGNVKAFARALVDAGTDLVFGQGPHVTRAIELYKGKFISYSAGNFATFGKINLTGPNGLAPIFKIIIDDKGNFLRGKIIAVKQDKAHYGPYLDKTNAVVKKIIELNHADFPAGTGLAISPNGDINKAK